MHHAEQFSLLRGEFFRYDEDLGIVEVDFIESDVILLAEQHEHVCLVVFEFDVVEAYLFDDAAILLSLVFNNHGHLCGPIERKAIKLLTPDSWFTGYENQILKKSSEVGFDQVMNNGLPDSLFL